MKGLDRGSLIGCDALVASLRSYFFPLGPSSVVGVVSLADNPLPAPHKHRRIDYAVWDCFAFGSRWAMLVHLTMTAGL